MTDSKHVTPRVHIGCGGAVLWDLSGGYCTKCHAEYLEPDEAERGPAGYWISDECAGEACGACPGRSPEPDTGPCAHPCHEGPLPKDVAA